MTDYTELKRLAETVNQTYADLCEHGGDELAEAWHSAELAYDDAANPDVVMSLIATIDVLRSDIESRCEWINEASAEIDRLQNIEVERDQLKAENEALRRERDARHPFKPFHEPAIGFTGCVICGVYTDHGGLPCPKTRAAAIALSMENQRLTPVEPLRVPHPLEAAMGKGEQS